MSDNDGALDAKACELTTDRERARERRSARRWDAKTTDPPATDGFAT